MSDPAAYAQALQELETSSTAFGCAVRRGDDASGVAERVCVIKLNRFNDRAPGARDVDLASIGRDFAGPTSGTLYVDNQTRIIPSGVTS